MIVLVENLVMRFFLCTAQFGLSRNFWFIECD